MLFKKKKDCRVDMKKLILLAFLVFASLFSIGQEGYIATDTVLKSGANVRSGGKWMNAKYCVVENAGVITRYSPYSISEFELK